jgi:NADH-quinone oxidoreductase subunit G
VLPRENEAVNECWLSDKDRFSYEGLNSPERLIRPMLKQGGQWQEVEWQVALEYVATGLKQIAAEHGAHAIAALATPHHTLEELYLLGKLTRALGSNNVDFRLRQSDFSADGNQGGAPWLGLAVAELNQLQRVLVVGSSLRKDHPLIAQRFRQAVKKGCEFNLINPIDDELLMPVANKGIVAPGALAETLAQVLKALAEAKQAVLPADLGAVNAVQVSDAARNIAASLGKGGRTAVFLGNLVEHHPQRATLHRIAVVISALTGSACGFLGEAANSVGGFVANALPVGGLNAQQMLQDPRKAYLLLGVEADLDCYDAQTALHAMHGADMVVALSAYKHKALDYADVLLPIAPFTETAGTFISTEGRVQSFNGVVRPLGEARPAWKVLRVLGNLLGKPGFEFEDVESVRREVAADLDGFVKGKLSNALDGVGVRLGGTGPTLQRIGEIPIYQADPIVRRAPSLQKTRDAAAPVAALPAALFDELQVKEGEEVRVTQGGGSATLKVIRDDKLPRGCVRVPAGHSDTAMLGALFGEIRVERA